MDDNQIIKLNVGGVVFLTTKATLLFDRDSQLAKLARGDLQNQVFISIQTSPKKTSSGKQEIFIDRDGTNFRHLLNYLRTGHVVLPDEKNTLKEILLEAQFYNIKGVINELCKPRYQIKGILPMPLEQLAFWDSLILDSDKKKYLERWIGDEGKTCTANLLYRATRDGWSADIFHLLCDDKASTVVLARRGSSVFGGFTQQSWSGTGSKTDKNAFLLSLSSPSGLGPIKIPLQEGEEEDAIFCHPTQGPVFGKGRDLVISHQPHQSNCSSRLGNTYKCPANQVPTLFLTGTLTFTIAELEVYEVC